jgi:hypothetical protein
MHRPSATAFHGRKILRAFNRNYVLTSVHSLSSTGLAYRRCQLVRVAGYEVGVEFLAHEKRPKKKQEIP